jgi:hypothetical protein
VEEDLSGVAFMICQSNFLGNSGRKWLLILPKVPSISIQENNLFYIEILKGKNSKFIL